MDLNFITKHDKEIKRAIRFDVTVVPSYQGIHRLSPKARKKEFKRTNGQSYYIRNKNIVT